VDVAAGSYHSLLLRSDGRAILFGRDDFGQCSAPELPDDIFYQPTERIEMFQTSTEASTGAGLLDDSSSTSMPSAVPAVPPSLEVAASLDSPTASGEFSVVMRKESAGKIGLKVDEDDAKTSLRVTKVKDGLIQSWNMANPALEVRAGDYIVEVNGIRGSAPSMFDALSGHTELRLVLVRRAPMTPGSAT